MVEDKYFKFADILNTMGAECTAAAAARKAKAIAQLHNVAAQLGFLRGWDLQDPDADRWDGIGDPRPLGFSRACSRRSRGGQGMHDDYYYDRTTTMTMTTTTTRGITSCAEPSRLRAAPKSLKLRRVSVLPMLFYVGSSDPPCLASGIR